jgi:putative nucleotidyltransferase with HDIG domain
MRRRTLSLHHRPRLGWWALAWLVLVGGQLAAATAYGTSPQWVHPNLLFVVVVIAASGCVLTSSAVIVSAHRSNVCELGLMGSFSMAVSALPLVHGLTIPGIIYGDNPATMSSVFWALPLASVIALPLVAPMRRWSLAICRHWRWWVGAHLAVVIGLCAGLLLQPTLLPFPAMNSRSAIAWAVASLAVCGALSLRQLRLSWIGGSIKPFAVSLGFAFVGGSSLVWVAKAPFTLSFWMAHVLDIGGVFALTIGGLIAYRHQPSMRSLLEPLTVHTPLAAFELGLEPIVHQFVASLEAKDPVTRDHVVRSAELAMLTGEAMGLSSHDLHLLGLGALLHDVGKLTIPSHIINKPDRLNDEEFAVIRTHAAAGFELVSESMVLRDIGPIVRGHHERLDGRGYPDGLRGDEISLLARIVSVCDAFDAMANTRQYRTGMGIDRAIAILQEHAGSQWDPAVVEALVSVVRRGLPAYTVLAGVGRSDAHASTLGCGCVDALPDNVLVGISAKDS